MEDETTGQPEGENPNGLAGFLKPHPISGGVGKDMAIINTAVRKNWDVPQRLRAEAMVRLRKIIRKDTVSVPQGESGSFDSESIADRNAISATNTLLSMTGQEQADRHHVEKIDADAKHPKGDRSVRILLVDARGAERAVNLREFYDSTVIDPPASLVRIPASDAPRPNGEQGR